MGRGSLAGPLLVVAARQTADFPVGLTDSKLLTKKQRLNLLPYLVRCCSFGEGWVTSVEIDQRGINSALRLGFKRALSKLHVHYDEEIIIDGAINYAPKLFKNASCIIKADTLVPAISAASVYAKLIRDSYMGHLTKKHPGYGFENHVGYGTQAHMAAIASLKPIKNIHRASFKPIKNLVVD